MLTGVISEKEALASIDLKVVLLFGGSLTLAKALDTTGAGELIADKIVGLLGADLYDFIADSVSVLSVKTE